MQTTVPSSFNAISNKPISWPKSPVKFTRTRARFSPMLSIDGKRVTVW
jgi:hypothetical protein